MRWSRGVRRSLQSHRLIWNETVAGRGEGKERKECERAERASRFGR